jgi:uncharacterized phage protein gp47/JayE
MKSFNEIVQDISNYILSQRSDIDVKPASVISDIFIEPAASEIEKLYYRIYNISLSLSVLTASGSQLDMLALNVGLTRRQAIKATGLVTFYRNTPDPTNDYIIPLGTRVSTVGYYGMAPVYFRTTESVTLIHGNTEVDASVECEQAGTIGNVQANKIVVINTPVNGITGVTNDNAFDNGMEQETDEEFRRRIIETALGNDAGTESSIKKVTLETLGVSSAFVALASGTVPASRGIGKVDVYIKGSNIQNATDYVIYHTGTNDYILVYQPAKDITSITGFVSSVPHTFVKNTDYQLGDYVDDRGIHYGIVHWLSGTRPDNLSVFTVNYTFNKVIRDVQIALESKRWVTMDIWAREATPVTIDVTMSIVVYQGFDQTAIASQVASAITDYINNLALGEDIEKADLIYIAKSQPGVDNVNITVPASDITIDGDEYAVAGTIQVT